MDADPLWHGVKAVRQPKIIAKCFILPITEQKEINRFRKNKTLNIVQRYING